MRCLILFFFCFNPTSPTETYTLSLHDALPICGADRLARRPVDACLLELAQDVLPADLVLLGSVLGGDRKSTRLNSSHRCISYAVFCLKKKTDEELDGGDVHTRISGLVEHLDAD